MEQEQKHFVVIGANGAIGNAVIAELSRRHPSAIIHAFSRKESTYPLPSNCIYNLMDITDETSVASAAELLSTQTPVDMIFVATGLLHQADMQPEKSLRDLTMDKFMQSFAVNIIGPALVAKHFLPLLHREKRGIFAALSARVGSISDNRLGGWYAYRSSKAALNMFIKNAAIETQRRYKQAVIVGLHPGTVDSPLSKPFQSHVADGHLFTPEYAAMCLLDVLDGLTPADSGLCFAWDGKVIEP